MRTLYRNAYLFVLAALFCSNASADVITVTVCMQIQFRAHYKGCPFSTDGMTFPVQCGDQYHNFDGLEVELWDKDNTNSDDYIGTWTLVYSQSSNQSSCAYFNWDQEARGESFPDVYPKTWWKVRDGGSRSQICNGNGEPGNSCPTVYGVTWRSSAVTDCSGTCYISPVSFTTDVAHTWNRQAMILFGASRFEDTYSTVSGRTHNIFYWVDPTDPCGGAIGVCQYGTNWVKYPFVVDGEEWYRVWETPPHEAGHSLQKQMFEDDSLDNENCPSPHPIDAVTHDACSTNEGWADYTSMVSWWNPNNSSSRPTYYYWNGIEDADPVKGTCSDNSKTELQVARAFWDMDDVNNENSVSPGSGDDDSSKSTSSMATHWDSFVDGTSNRQDREPGTNGMNLRDYLSYADPNGSDAELTSTLLFHNDVNCQSDL